MLWVSGQGQKLVTQQTARCFITSLWPVNTFTRLVLGAAYLPFLASSVHRADALSVLNRLTQYRICSPIFSVMSLFRSKINHSSALFSPCPFLCTVHAPAVPNHAIHCFFYALPHSNNICFNLLRTGSVEQTTNDILEREFLDAMCTLFYLSVPSLIAKSVLFVAAPAACHTLYPQKVFERTEPLISRYHCEERSKTAENIGED